MKEYTEEYLKEIRDIIGRHDSAEARAELASLHPADIAELFQNLDQDEREYLYGLLDEEKAADVLMELDEDERLKLINDMPAEEKAPVFYEKLKNLLNIRNIRVNDHGIICIIDNKSWLCPVWFFDLFFLNIIDFYFFRITIFRIICSKTCCFFKSTIR